MLPMLQKRGFQIIQGPLIPGLWRLHHRARMIYSHSASDPDRPQIQRHGRLLGLPKGWTVGRCPARSQLVLCLGRRCSASNDKWAIGERETQSNDQLTETKDVEVYFGAPSLNSFISTLPETVGITPVVQIQGRRIPPRTPRTRRQIRVGFNPTKVTGGGNILGSPIAKKIGKFPVEFPSPPKSEQVGERGKEGSASINNSVKNSRPPSF
ncbi:hypothetical protein MLD38_040382 [Melastoma candidum]|uniref:Uncharacterized protein n=1 Tax=Melastoma candidum TaxID=119954 RepID=A0ACB9L5Y2_9MYRT|nr:hypothetical protein MLD38_040382 [Melastoma candidum]